MKGGFEKFLDEYSYSMLGFTTVAMDFNGNPVSLSKKYQNIHQNLSNHSYRITLPKCMQLHTIHKQLVFVPSTVSSFSLPSNVTKGRAAVAQVVERLSTNRKVGGPCSLLVDVSLGKTLTP